ncbi:MAG: NTP transferase domain-containing protein [Patescibacteria group bacterium]|nr:NTP transferase domain-containing protein [Patescibacteria group bacterium]
MKCVILAAGEGMRMRPLTLETPKPMLAIDGRPILEHLIDSLPGEIDEVIVVVGYLRHQIQSYFGSRYRDRRIEYAVQQKKEGTYRVLELCRPFLDDERFLLLYADDLHGRDGLRICVESGEYCMLVSAVSDPRRFGVVEVDGHGRILNIEEKPERPKSNLVLPGPIVLDKTIFHYGARPHANGEFYLTDSLAQMVEAGYPMFAVRSNFWLPINTPDDLARARAAIAPERVGQEVG